MGKLFAPTELLEHADTAEAIQFLRMLHPMGPWHISAIVPDGAITNRTFGQDDVAALHDFIDARQGRQNLYFHVNELSKNVSNKKAKKSDVAFVLAAHVDIDDLEGVERLKKHSPLPTAVVSSGGGYNAYWMYDEKLADKDRGERINSGLVEQLGGDRAATDASRILRLPGTINLPTKKKIERGRKPKLARLVPELTDWERKYDPGQFCESLRSLEPTRAGFVPGNVRASIVPSAVPENCPDWLRHLAETGDDPDQPRDGENPRYPSRSEAVWALVCGLAREGMDVTTIAGVLKNPALGISESILEKRDPSAAAVRQAERAALTVGEEWPDGNREESRVPKKTFQNTQAALLRLGVQYWFDDFRQRPFVGGHAIQAFQGELNDRACLQLRDMVNKTFGFDPGKDGTRDAVEQLCNQNVVDPVCDYLGSLTWDGTPRIDQWLVDFAGAECSAYVRAVSAIVLIAAVRRPRQPGVKFDNILVLEGPQGSGKSTLLRILASDEFFSDQDLLALDQKTQMEALEGVWIYELCELAGMRYTDINKIKAFASRAVDRARPAYARFSDRRPRRGILVGTTNDDEYLKDATGNRRFWPVRTGGIDLEGLAKCRDQLWAEAAFREAQGESLELPQELWSIAAREQSKRVEADGWEIVLEALEGSDVVGGREIVTSDWVLRNFLGVPAAQIKGYQFKRLKRAMNGLGWTGPTTVTLANGEKAKGYWKLTDRPEGKSSPDKLPI